MMLNNGGTGGKTNKRTFAPRIPLTAIVAGTGECLVGSAERLLHKHLKYLLDHAVRPNERGGGGGFNVKRKHKTRTTTNDRDSTGDSNKRQGREYVNRGVDWPGT